jgi:hypothetical protein
VVKNNNNHKKAGLIAAPDDRTVTLSQTRSKSSFYSQQKGAFNIPASVFCSSS